MMREDHSRLLPQETQTNASPVPTRDFLAEDKLRADALLRRIFDSQVVYVNQRKVPRFLIG